MAESIQHDEEWWVTIEAASADVLGRARAALERHAWDEAFALYSEADAAGELSGADLEAFALSAFFSGRADAQLEIVERAFKAHETAGDAVRAAYIALFLAGENSHRGRASFASGWTRRGARLLEGLPETYAHGYLALAQSDEARNAGQIERALELAEQAVAIAQRTADRDLRAWSQAASGELKIATGAKDEGIALLEDAAFAAVNGELDPVTAGVTSCRMIAACRDLNDYRRATEWTNATQRWCEQQSVSGFPGVCRLHRAEVVALSGAWERAEAELRRATTELAGYAAVPVMADGYYAIGQIRLRLGDLDGAEEAFRQANGLGRSPQPGLALVRLAQGNLRGAAAAIRAALAEETWDQLARMRLLPAQVEIAIAAGDVAAARVAADELSRLTETYQSPALRAMSQEASGRVLLADGDHAGAARELRACIGQWREVGAPYEIARARALLAAALAGLGDDDGADLELRTARDEFVRLGARLDVDSAAKSLEAAARRRASPQQARRTFMFTDIVGSTKLAEALGDEAWDGLLQWHNDALRSLIARGGGEVVATAGDGFFVAFESARKAVDTAIAIQEALAEHRRSTGFALTVRIGLHAADANARDGNYSGIGVHTASRVASLAQGGQILATVDTLDEAGVVDVADVTEVSVKGVSVPIRIASVKRTSASNVRQAQT